jgi:hypothetical protein
MATLHPTIIIGFGRYGLTLLQRFLADAASRGRLSWDLDEANPGGRRPRRLALLYLPAADEPAIDVTESLIAGQSFEMMQDLFEQIEPVAATTAAVAEAVSAAGRRLLTDEGGRASSHGLDLIVLAQPRSPAALGQVRNLLEPGMKALIDYRSLESPRRDLRLLNFVLMLDFEDLWSSSSAPLRRALQAIVEQQTGTDLPAFGRIYLFDGARQSARQRQERERIEEAHVFLDLLLLEGQRTSLSFLYQQVASDEPPLCAVGLRTVERDRELLARLAAARFGVDWLAVVVQSDGPEPPDNFELAQLASRFRPEALVQRFAGASLRQGVASRIAGLEQGLLGTGFHEPGWPDTVWSQIESARSRVFQEMAGEIRTGLRRPVEQQLEQLPAQVRDAATKALLGGGSPVTLGAMLVQLHQILETLKPGAELPGLGPPASGLQLLERAHSQYRDVTSDLVDTDRVWNWWVMLALVGGVLLAPILGEGLLDLPPMASPLALARLRAGLDWLAEQPALLALICSCAAFGTGAAFHGAVEGRVQEARGFFEEKQRGRLIAVLRRVLATCVGEPLESEGRRVAEEASRRVAGEAALHFRAVHESLEKRKAEIDWLRGQLADFLRLHGVRMGVDRLQFTDERAGQNGVRITLETSSDLEAFVPRSRSSAAEYQSQWGLLESWDDVYHPRFLHPMAFLDWLAERLQDSALWRPAAENLSAIAAKIRDVGPLPTAFYWLGATDLPPEQAFSVVPESWAADRDIKRALDDEALPVKATAASAGRAFLIRLQSGVPGRLLAAGDHA